ncbi:S-formylglutathione hydrolase [Phalaenopsis equestris]|uniref:S-formylglutathione hydrolase n=1 Tax=Phalaenopsis equestris TaxID=78828 RepID=UPI0009E44C7A|nr:S-formylglutathione hydrolase [Phalaenopsis equestris]
MEKLEEISSSKMFGGYNRRFRHFSPTLGCSMTFSIYFPPSSPSQKIPVLYWLSGLTCNDENFIMKSGAQRAASSEEVALVAPDTSPRGLNIDGEADSWDFGVGAGFYLNATEEKWKNWRMYDYIVKELPKLLDENFEQLDTSKASIFGHSMGGHGALTIFLKNLDKYKSASAFSPIVNPINCPWGQKAFLNYLGGDKSDWEVYDATCLVAKYNKFSTPILIDQAQVFMVFTANGLLGFLNDSFLCPSQFVDPITDSQVCNSQYSLWILIDQNLSVTLYSIISTPRLMCYTFLLTRRSGILLLKYCNQPTAKTFVDNIVVAWGKLDTEDIILYTLNGLPATYKASRRQFRSQLHPIDLDDFYSLLCSEEINSASDNQRSHPYPQPHLALAATRVPLVVFVSWLRPRYNLKLYQRRPKHTKFISNMPDLQQIQSLCGFMLASVEL